MKFFNIGKGLILSNLFSAPFYVHFYVTERCNLRCKMCSVWKRGNKQKEMNLTEIRNAAEVLKKLNVPNIIITGGEPLLRKDIIEIIRIFSGKGFSVRLQTNCALLTPELLDKLIEAGLNDITISLDTLDSEKFDKICNSHGLFEQVSKSLDFIPKKLKKGIVIVNTVVSKLNISEIPEIIKFVTNKGAYSSLVPAQLAHSEADKFYFRAMANELSFHEDQVPLIKKTYSEIIQMKKRGYNIVSSTRFLRESAKSLITLNDKWGCKAGQLFFVIYSDGSVAPCDDFPPLLDIKKDFLKEFKSKEYIEKVKQIQKKCPGCTYGCWREITYFITNFDTKMEQLKIYLQNRTK